VFSATASRIRTTYLTLRLAGQRLAYIAYVYVSTDKKRLAAWRETGCRAIRRFGGFLVFGDDGAEPVAGRAVVCPIAPSKKTQLHTEQLWEFLWAVVEAGEDGLQILRADVALNHFA
jgi:hypothetical protein